MSKRSTERLATLVRDYLGTGNQAAVEEVFRRTRPQLLSVARRIAADADAEDAVQSAYLSLFRKTEIPDDLPVLPWLVTATVRISYRQLALRRRQGETAKRLAYERTQRAEAADHGASQREECALIRSAVDRLPDHYRDVVILHHLQGLSTQEVADLLEVPHGTVCTWLHRARAMLRSRLTSSLANMLVFLPLALAGRAGATTPGALAVTGAIMKTKTVLFTLLVLVLLSWSLWELVTRLEPGAANALPDDAAAAAGESAPAGGAGAPAEPAVSDGADRSRAAAEPAADPGGDPGEDTPIAGAAAAPGPGAAAVAGEAAVVVGGESAVLSGTVLDPHGLPIAGARVLTTRMPPGIIRARWQHVDLIKPISMHGWTDGASAATDESGRFERVVTAPADSDITVTLFAVHDEHRASAMRQLEIRGGTEKTGLVFTLQPGEVLAGRVVDEGGAALAGVQVTAEMARVSPYGYQPPILLQSVETDESGTFSFTGLPPDERFLLRAAAPGAAMRDAASERSFFSGTEGILLVLVQEAVVRGRVLDTDEAPVAGARVTLRRAQDEDGVSGTSQADGSYELHGLAAGAYSALCRKEGMQRRQLELVLEGGERREGVDFMLGAAGVVTGSVRDDAGRAVPDVSVRAKQGDEVSAAVSASDGSFTLTDILGGSYTLSLQGDSVYTLEWNQLRRQATAGDHIDIVLPAGLTLRARVHSEEGEAVEHLWVEVMVQATGSRGLGFAHRGSHSDPEGDLEIARVPGEAAQLVIAAQGYARLRVDLRGRLSPPVTDLGDLTLLRGARLSGRVTLPDGAPAAGAALSLWGLPPGGSVLQHRLSGIQATEHGAYEIQGVAAGSYRIRAQLEPYSQAEIGVEVTGDHDEDGLDLQLSTGGTIGGRVLGLEGEPLGAATVSAWLLPYDPSRATHPTRTDAAGLYEITGLDDGHYRVSLIPQRTADGALRGMEDTYAQERTVEGGAWVGCDFDLGGLCRVHGRVLGWTPDTGDASADRTHVTLEGAGASVHTIVSDDGHYALPPVPPGECSLTLWRGQSRWQATESTRVSLTVPAAAEFEFDIDAGGTTLSGLVTRQDGGDVSGAVVVAYPHGGRYVPGAGTLHRAEVDAGGAFEIRHVPDGRYDLTAISQGHGQAILRDLEIDGNAAIGGIRLEIVPSGSVRLTASGRGEDAAPLSIRVEDSRGQATSPTDTREAEPGEWLLSGLPPGEYRVYAGTPTTGTAWAQATVTAERETAVHLSFARQSGLVQVVTRNLLAGASARIVLVDSASRDLPDMRSGGWAVGVFLREDGTHDLGRYPAGSYSLRVENSTGPPTLAPLDLLAGTPVRVDVDLGAMTVVVR